MTRPRGESTSSTPGESELAGRQEPRRPRPADASEALSERLAARARGGDAGGGNDRDDDGEAATDELLDAKEERKSKRRKAPGPTRDGGAADATGADGIPEPLFDPTEPTDPTEPADPADRPGG